MSQPTTEKPKQRSRGRIRVETGAKRIRAFLGGIAVADTSRPLLVWEKPYYPAYYFPVADVRTELLEADLGVVHSPSRGDARTFTVRAGGLRSDRGSRPLRRAPRGGAARPSASVGREAVPAEEDEQVFTHQRPAIVARRRAQPPVRIEVTVTRQ